ncbi:hypothetical protein CSC66_09065 [Pseudoxanthomonas kaohsiungensis]|nr:hypothetical protein CSC66_09065 [Pseudoxanthomonas kaohsiungensis]
MAAYDTGDVRFFFKNEVPVLLPIRNSAFPLPVPLRSADGHPLPPFMFSEPVELTDENREVDTDEVRNALIAEYEAFNMAQGLNLGSADEHLFDTALTLEQLVWVRDFSNRWELNEHLASEQHRSQKP